MIYSFSGDDIMKKVVCLFLVLVLIFTFASCSNREIEVDPQEWGSFSPNKTTSYDNKYYALQTVNEYDYIVVNDDLDTAVNNAVSIILSNRLKLDKNLNVIDEVLNNVKS